MNCCRNCNIKSDKSPLRLTIWGNDKVLLCSICIKLAERNGIFDKEGHYHQLEINKGK